MTSPDGEDPLFPLWDRESHVRRFPAQSSQKRSAARGEFYLFSAMAPPVPCVALLLTLLVCVAHGQLNAIGTLPLPTATELILTSTATKVNHPRAAAIA